MQAIWNSRQDAIERIERQLRGVIHDVLSAEFGPAWASELSAGLGADRYADLQEKAAADRGAQRAVFMYDLPIAYGEFLDLRKLLEKHWPRFTSVFPSADRFWTFYTEAERLRNIVKHHRDITPTQGALLVGIAGEIEVLSRSGASARHWNQSVRSFNSQTSSERQTEHAKESSMSSWRP